MASRDIHGELFNERSPLLFLALVQGTRRVIAEDLAQHRLRLFSSVKQAAHHRAFGNAQNKGHLLVSEPVDLSHDENGSVVFAERGERALKLGPQFTSQRRLLWALALCTVGLVLRAFVGKRVVVDVHLFATTGFANKVDGKVVRDSISPSGKG